MFLTYFFILNDLLFKTDNDPGHANVRASNQRLGASTQCVRAFTQRVKASTQNVKASTQTVKASTQTVEEKRKLVYFNTHHKIHHDFFYARS